RLHLYFNRILKSDLLECFVPHQNAVADRIAIFHGDRVFQPVNDWLFWRRQRRGRILFDEVPAIDVALRGGVAVVVAVVLDRIYEMAHASVCQSWAVTCVWSLADAITQVKEHAADVGKITRRRWQRWCWSTRRQDWRQRRTFGCVMRDRF